jgi:hypothetical protein
VTATPSYGFRISGQSQTGPMTTAMQAGDIGGIQKILKERFPGLEFETMGTEMEEVDKPAEASVAATPTTPVVGTAAKEGEDTTASLFNDYMTGLPGGVRGLVTTDYKGVRGGRLGAGNYSTASILPGAQAETPAVAPAAPTAPAAPSTGGGSTYNAPVNYGNWEQYYGDVNYGTIGGSTDTTPTAPATETQPAAQPKAGFTPAWATTQKQKPTTISQASSGQVASTTDRGSYVSPGSSSAPAGAQAAYQRTVERVQSTGNTGVLAAAGGRGETLSRNEAAALIAAPGNNKQAAQSALKQAEKGNIQISNQTRKALEQAASGKKKK